MISVLSTPKLMSSTKTPKTPDLKAIAARLRRKQMLDFANSLAVLADNAPDERSRTELYRAARRLRLRASSSKEKRKRILLRVIGRGATTVAEIAHESGFSEPSCRKTIAVLLEENLIRCETLGGRRNCGRKGATRYYFPV